jgi:hypothetical protein
MNADNTRALENKNAIISIKKFEPPPAYAAMPLQATSAKAARLRWLDGQARPPSKRRKRIKKIDKIKHRTLNIE